MGNNSNQEAEPSSDFPVYRVKAKCPCGKMGWANSFTKPEPEQVITASCGKCCEEHTAKVEKFSRVDMKGKPSRKKSSPSSQPSSGSGDRTHWTDRLP